VKIDPARKPKAQSRDNYKVLVADMRSIMNSTALIKWWKNNADSVNALHVSWDKAINEEFNISLSALFAKETGAKVEVKETTQHFAATEKEPGMTSVYDETESTSNTLKAKDLADRKSVV